MVLTVLLFAAAYFVVQRLTSTLRFLPVGITTIWAPGALLFTALLLVPPRRWWVFYAGLCLGIFASFYGDTKLPVGTALLAAQFHFVVVAMGAWQVRRFGSNALLGNLTSVLLFFVIAVVLVSVITVAPIHVVLFLSGANDIWPVFIRDALSVALGMLIATPALTLTLANGRAWLRARSWHPFAEVAALATALVGTGYLIFDMPRENATAPALLYAPLPLLLWAAVRFELAGASAALLLLAYQSTWGAIHGRGPFASQPPVDSVFQLQLFLLAISLPLMVLATAIQERRQASLALSEAEKEVRREYAQLATIYQTAPVGLAFVDTQLRFVSMNDHLAEINGLSADAHLGRTVRQVLPHLADTVEPIYRRVIATGQPVVDTEVRGAASSRPHSERSWLVSYYPVQDSQGTTLGVNTVVQEVTERRRTEERFRLVVESTPNAIVMVNAEGAIVLVNSQCEIFFGYRREELLGRPVEVLVPERFRPKHPGYRTDFFASPSARPMGGGRDLFGRRKDGSEFPVEVGLTPIRSGAGLFVLCAIVDITTRKQAEEARRELAHASRLALVGELTASIAHEINQPLGAILSNADAGEMLLESSPPALDQVREILGDIRKDDLRASEVIRRLRTLLSKGEVERKPVNLNEVLSDVMLLVRAESRRRGITMDSRPENDLPLVRGDKVHLQQVMLNLVFNGMEAMAEAPGEKRVTVRTGVNENGSAEIAISDTGSGILPYQLPRVFDPFFSTKKDGMGLGLSIARSLVEAHGGRIWVENNPDGGATFRFTLPTGREQPNPESRGTLKAPAGASA
jgi:two-component system sensor kinase FixL